ncbi:L-histidine N(alpha)-methyltransferase [Cytophagales bacterium RKSG123]|nr:L-histidine N(alpha)-methyltransferase [Xanthovirga aplysinae]
MQKISKPKKFTTKEEFVRDVLIGLQSNPKKLSSKYFYDEKGDKLFQEIMNLEEYYLTNCEYEILNTHKSAILELFESNNRPFQLIELGAGDGLKTKVLLQEFSNNKAHFEYSPIDISPHVLQTLTNDLQQLLPNLKVKSFQGDYFKALAATKRQNGWRKVVLFLGSNIGNFSIEQTHNFLTKIKDLLSPGDLLFIGFDLKKEPEVILSAYNDKKGVTRAFNLNLLSRINAELDGNFDLNKFEHYPVYDPQSGECRSYLVSKENQQVRLEALEETISFHKWESIHTEISRKFSTKEIHELAERSGFKLLENFYDSKGFFVDSVWLKK